MFGDNCQDVCRIMDGVPSFDCQNSLMGTVCEFDENNEMNYCHCPDNIYGKDCGQSIDCKGDSTSF